MIVVWGWYRFARKRVGYRNDYCLSCDQASVAELIRSFNVGHFFFIPCLPLGVCRRWVCSSCGEDPHARAASPRSFRVFVALAFAAFTAVAWLVLFERAEDMSFVFGFRLVMTLGFLAAIAWTLLGKPPANLAEKLAGVPPAPADACLYCMGTLDPQGTCTACFVRRYEVRGGAVGERESEESAERGRV